MFKNPRVYCFFRIAWIFTCFGVVMLFMYMTQGKYSIHSINRQVVAKRKELHNKTVLRWAQNWPTLQLPSSPQKNTSMSVFRSCIQLKWIYIIGDSSARIFKNALLYYIRSEFNSSIGLVDSQSNECGGRNTGAGYCMREYVDLAVGIRITYSWKTYFDVQPPEIEMLAIPGAAPDIFIYATGAWDTHLFDNSREHNFTVSALETVKVVQSLAYTYSTSLVLAMTVVSCNPYTHLSVPWNKEFRSGLLKMSTIGGRLAFLDREPSTFNLAASEPGDPTGCFGFHADRDLSLQHARIILESICL